MKTPVLSGCKLICLAGCWHMERCLNTAYRMEARWHFFLQLKVDFLWVVSIPLQTDKLPSIQA